MTQPNKGLFAVKHLKSAQNRLVSDVLGVLTSFGSSNLLLLLTCSYFLLALSSDPTETFVQAGDPAVKNTPSMQKHTVHTKEKI